ncbi:MAG: fatty acid desaturase [Pirellulaceae bacterium]|nr:fatty acid desaturase [Pirellulaceae bacterium]
MRSEKELLIATRAFAQEHSGRSWWAVWSTVLAYLGCLIVCLSGLPLFVRILASGVSGLLIVRMFIIYHDFQHHAILSRSWAARWILNVYGLLVLSPPSVWNRSHNHHHKNNSKDMDSAVGSFPTMTSEQFQQASLPARWHYFIARHPLTILLGYLTVFMYGMCIQAFLRKPLLHWDAMAALAIHGILIAGLLMLGWDALWLCLLAPLMLACCLGSYLFYAQHNFPGCRLELRDNWNHAKAALQSSSYLKMGPLMNWFTGNIGLHHIHHLNARIPFYRLPEAMAQLPELQKPASTTLHPADVLACFRANLWDEALQRFVSYREARYAYQTNG